jgi:prepilin-type N-terminal cleavage/methylation domain-containing protein
MKINQKTKSGFTLVELLVVIVIIAALAGLTAPQVLRMKKKGDLAEATSNARQIGLALAQFDADVGGYPDDASVDAVKDLTGDDELTGVSGDDSNSYFRQLIYAGVTDSEQPFFAKTSYSKAKPNDVTNPAEEMLEEGEVGFGYIMKDATTSQAVVSGRPVCVAPLQSGVTTGKMEFDPYDGKAIALFTDSSVRQLTIRKTDNEALLSGGKKILEGGTGTVWESLGENASPVLKAPLVAE